MDSRIIADFCYWDVVWGVFEMINSETHDFIEDEVVVKVQKMFPNCAKYSKCCSESWNPKLENVEDVPKPEIIAVFGKENSLRKPEGFEDIK